MAAIGRKDHGIAASIGPKSGQKTKRTPRFTAFTLTTHLAIKVSRVAHSSHSHVSGRVAKFLLASATDGQVTNGVVRTRLALTHEDIAQLTGTSCETITRILSGFRNKDIIELKNSMLTIHDKRALERLVAA